MRWTFDGRARAVLIGSGASLVILTATVLPAASVLAAEQPTATTSAAAQHIGPHTHQLHGTVKTAPSSGGSSFTVTTERYGDVTVSLAATTSHGQGKGHGKAGAHGTTAPADLTTGDRVVVLGRTSDDGNSFVARRVHEIASSEDSDQSATQGSDQRATHVVGSVTSASGSSLTIKLADGSSQSFSVTADTRIRPRGKTVTDLTAGTKVTVVSKNGTANRIVITPA
jgi:hypothetical protein